MSASKTLSGYYRDPDGSIRPGRLDVRDTPDGLVTLEGAHALSIQRFQSVPGTIDVKITSPTTDLVFLASKGECQKAELPVSDIPDGPRQVNALAMLKQAVSSTDTIAMMGEMDDGTIQMLGDLSFNLRDTQTAMVELLGEAKRALHLLRKYEPQVTEHKQQCRASIANMERIFADRFGLTVAPARSSPEQAASQARPVTQEGGHER